MPSADERLATVEAVLLDIRGDVSDLRHDMSAARTRLHNLEGIAGSFVETQKSNRRNEAEQYRRLGLWIGLLTVVVGLAAVLAPIVTVILIGK